MHTCHPLFVSCSPTEEDEQNQREGKGDNRSADKKRVALMIAVVPFIKGIFIDGGKDDAVFNHHLFRQDGSAWQCRLLIIWKGEKTAAV